jgi:BirA family transcriptional regulator, biotin operon repressor / biotin---[acetyl-CoA-carboxylase] ligase
VIGQPRLYEPECESTQLLLLGSDLPEGAVAVTDHQTGGRGRLGRTWVDAPSTAVLVSVLVRPPPERRAPELSLVAALAVAEAVESATGLSAQIKWPNDVMLDRRKVAGILAEMRDGDVVVGIGLNVNQSREQYGEIGARDFVRGRRVTLDGKPGTGVMILRDGRLEVAFDEGGRTAVESGVLHVER